MIFSGGDRNIMLPDFNLEKTVKDEIEIQINPQTPTCYEIAPLLSKQGSDEYKDQPQL